MSFEWPRKSLSELADVFTGFSFKGEKYLPSGTGIRVVRGDNVTEHSVRWGGKEKCWPTVTEELRPFLLRTGDVVIGMDGLKVGKNFAGITLNDDGTLLAQRVARVRARVGVNQDFIRYLICNQQFTDYVQSVHTGTSIPHISKGQIQRFEVYAPPLQDQNWIASLLKALDDRITLLRETNATLEAIAQALFKSWFVDFDPVRAKLEGRIPEGMDEATAALFPDGFEESELGLVPRGWRLVPFGQLLSQTIGGDWGSDEPTETNDTKVAIIRGTDIPDLQSGANSRVPVRYTSQKKLATRRLEDGDIVLKVSGGSKDQPTGRALYLTNGILNQFDCPVEPASFCRLLRPNTKELGVLLGQHLIYIYAQGKTWEYQNQSTGIANFQTTHFLATELVAVPSNEVLVAFAAFVRSTIDRMQLTQVQDLATLRDTLLPRLISGQLRLPVTIEKAEETVA